MNNWKSLVPSAVMLALAWLVPAAYAQSRSTPTNSAANSPTRDTPASSRRPNVENACAAAADDLIATRQLVDSLDAENQALRSSLATERQAAALLTELNETRKAENAALRAAITAKNETIAAKDAVIASQDKLVGQLKSKRTSPWRRIGDVLIGVAIAAIIK
jgi:chromosome segregation ATPase